ncbi:MAG: diacylglycerol kinase family protein [Ferruginibacter sp.]
MKIIKSFVFAWHGLKICFTSETNFKIHVLASIVALLLGAVLNISVAEWLVIIFCIAFVAAMEMVNTALEKLCDVVHEDSHPGIKGVKDIAAGAVLISAICSLIIGLIVFIPKIIMYIKSFQN